MPTAEALTQLVAQNYAVTAFHLVSIHLFEHEDRGVYKVERAGRPPLLLRACRCEPLMAKWLTETANALDALETVGYPAPVVQHTNQDELVATDGAWIALLLTFIEGDLVSDSLSDLEAMGTMLARLHLLDSVLLRKVEPSIPFCRWYPKTKLQKWLTELESVAHLIPAELEHRYQFCVDAVGGVLSWADLPIALLHTDCNPQNAIRGAEGQIIFIDWDGIGFGPAILDLGYLLFYCHVLQESWPVIKPNAAWIEAILQGYCKVERYPSPRLNIYPTPSRWLNVII